MFNIDIKIKYIICNSLLFIFVSSIRNIEIVFNVFYFKLNNKVYAFIITNFITSIALFKHELTIYELYCIVCHTLTEALSQEDRWKHKQRVPSIWLWSIIKCKWDTVYYNSSVLYVKQLILSYLWRPTLVVFIVLLYTN